MKIIYNTRKLNERIGELYFYLGYVLVIAGILLLAV